MTCPPDRCAACEARKTRRQKYTPLTRAAAIKLLAVAIDKGGSDPLITAGVERAINLRSKTWELADAAREEACSRARNGCSVRHRAILSFAKQLLEQGWEP